jgi:glutathione S-transferase
MSAGTLYTSSGSGNSYKVRLLAGILGIDLKHEEISLKVHFSFHPSQHPYLTNSNDMYLF